MRIDSEALCDHAAEVSRERLLRARGRLAHLSPRQLGVVEDTANAVGQAVARCLLECADADEGLANVLSRLYPSVGDPKVTGLDLRRGSS